MKRGKQTCKILKDIRRQIAEANDIEFITSECQYQGDCLGLVPSAKPKYVIWNNSWNVNDYVSSVLCLNGNRENWMTERKLPSALRFL